MNEIVLDKNQIKALDGGLGLVKGLRCAGVSAGFRRNPKRLDLALVVAPPATTAAGVFTQNRFCAAPVELSRKHLAGHHEAQAGAGGSAAAQGIRAIVLNSGNANATTGQPGLKAAQATCQIAAELLNCQPEQILVASTGVIGVLLDEQPFVGGLQVAQEALSDGSGSDAQAGLSAAQAIMTTDTVAKQAAVSFTVNQSDGSSVNYRVAGICKGSGMIQPQMATMLAVLATDAAVSTEALDKALREAVDVSFNKVTVDSDTSTNDSVFLLATGGQAGELITPSSSGYSLLVSALKQLCENLARQIARDGEGATKLITVQVSGAATDADADAAARSIANSPLVKTAIAGHDANWGRIAMALGKSAAQFEPERVSITLMGLEVCRAGLPVAFSEQEALERFAAYDEIVLAADLGAGSASATIWTCDFTHDYISINADYRS